ncbi:serine/arginine repetitive matrix protein 1-like isoform X3 [Schistocerca piceifrons]|uniref:serine/arginine repetitive matrix protein 1-like isoform X3 n=1 Tax=Schistocerca piceifrons TaxID=274613 RepID=UPI001F5ED7D3|nr:serine/arginine repetitive matrix protein 1-like isoform X3 [Schistocerca piceifrons]
MKFPLSSFVLQLAAVYLSCFGAVTRGRAFIPEQQVSTLPLTGAQERPFMTLYNNTAGAATVGHDYHSEATETSDGTPEDLERTPTFYDRAASIEHEDSLSKSGLHNSQETFGTDPLHTSSASAKAATLHRRIERDAQKPWLPDDEGSGFSSETELDDEDLFLQQRRAARRGRKEGRTPGRRKNVDWLQLQGVTSHRVEQKSDHSRPQAAGKNELPSPEQAPRNGDPTRRPPHTGAAKRRPKKRHRTKATKHAPSRQLPDTKPVSSSGSSSSAGHGSQQHHRQQQQQQQQQPEQGQLLQTHRTAPAQPPPRKFGGGDMSLESRIRALKKIASGSQEDELTAAHSPELPAFYSGDSPGWSARDEWASGWDHRLWHVLGSGSGSGSGTQPYGDPGRPDSGLVPPPPMPATPPPTPPPPPCRSTAATPVSAAGAAHNPPPTQRVTEAQSVAAASHHQEAFVAVSMVELPGNHSRNHSNKNHDQTQQQQQHQHVSPEKLSTRTARWETPDTTTAASFFPVAVQDSDISLSSDYWDSGGLEALPTWFRLRHRGRNHFRKQGAMEALMNRHREEQWLRRRFGLPPESPHQQFAG